MGSIAVVEHKPHPLYPDTTAYRIHGPDWLSVQRAVSDLLNERGVDHAVFEGPKRIVPIGWGVPLGAGRWWAAGFVTRIVSDDDMHSSIDRGSAGA